MTASSPSSRAPSSARGWASPSTSRRARTPSNRDGTQVHLRQKRSSSATTKSATTLGFRLVIAPRSMVAVSCVLDLDLRSNDPRHLPDWNCSQGLVGNIGAHRHHRKRRSHFYFVCSKDRLPTKQATILATVDGDGQRQAGVDDRASGRWPCLHVAAQHPS